MVEAVAGGGTRDGWASKEKAKGTGRELLGNWCRVKNNTRGFTKEAVKFSWLLTVKEEKMYLNLTRKIKKVSLTK